MNNKEKVEWAKRAFKELADDCQEIADLKIVEKAERRTWLSIKTKALRNIKVLDQ